MPSLNLIKQVASGIGKSYAKLHRNSGKALQDNFLCASDVKIRVKVDQARGKWHWLVGKVSHLQKSFLVVSATLSLIGKSVSALGQVNFLAASALEIRVDCQELHDLNLDVVLCASIYIK